jgi:hypothetical protein
MFSTLFCISIDLIIMQVEFVKLLRDLLPVVDLAIMPELFFVSFFNDGA